eukprot:scaffold1147_cov125-Isochrysis_galbana.AAC.7
MRPASVPSKLATEPGAALSEARSDTAACARFTRGRHTARANAAVRADSSATTSSAIPLLASRGLSRLRSEARSKGGRNRSRSATSLHAAASAIGRWYAAMRALARPRSGRFSSSHCSNASAQRISVPSGMKERSKTARFVRDKYGRTHPNSGPSYRWPNGPHSCRTRKETLALQDPPPEPLCA